MGEKLLQKFLFRFWRVRFQMIKKIEMKWKNNNKAMGNILREKYQQSSLAKSLIQLREEYLRKICFSSRKVLASWSCSSPISQLDLSNILKTWCFEHWEWLEKICGWMQKKKSIILLPYSWTFSAKIFSINPISKCNRSSSSK